MNRHALRPENFVRYYSHADSLHRVVDGESNTKCSDYAILLAACDPDDHNAFDLHLWGGVIRRPDFYRSQNRSLTLRYG